MKVCIKCNQEKEITNYYKNSRNKTGYDNICKLCKNKYSTENSKKLGKDYFCQASKKWSDKNREKISEYNKQNYNYDYYKTEKRKLYSKEWRQKNRHKLNEYQTKKYQKDIDFKLSILLRGRFNTVVVKKHKIGQIENLIGCTIEECRQYIEQQSKPEMNWNNHGEIWKIDHIKPCSSFDLTNIEQQKQCFHYTNIQPLFKTTEIAESFGYIDEIGNRNKTNKYLLI